MASSATSLWSASAGRSSFLKARPPTGAYSFMVRPPGMATANRRARATTEVGGDQHRFRVIQLPFNLAMPEALTAANHSVEGEPLSTLEAAERLDITVMCSASIYQAKLAHNLPPFVAEALKGMSTDAQRAIQFVRSAPGVTTALVGMSQRSHVEENMMVAKTPPAPIEEFLQMFSNPE